MITTKTTVENIEFQSKCELRSFLREKAIDKYGVHSPSPLPDYNWQSAQITWNNFLSGKVDSSCTTLFVIASKLGYDLDVEPTESKYGYLGYRFKDRIILTCKITETII